MAGEVTGDVPLGGWDVTDNCRLCFIADNCLNHECILQVTDVVAVLRLALVDACEIKRGEISPVTLF